MCILSSCYCEKCHENNVIYYVFCYYNYVHSVQRSWKYKLNIEINAVVIGKMIMKLLIVLFKALRIAIFLNKRLYFF